jgi:predicted hotdog family 3-hydroxylacyl-ACP dehydratase
MPQLLSHTDIACLMPHAGSMVLLDQIVQFDSDRIHCRATMNPAAPHPLAINGNLPGTALAEFGAQAMAVHGAMLSPPGTPLRQGRLVALGQLDLTVDRIDEPTVLDILATRLGGDDAGQMYGFEVRAGSASLAQGQATVMFADHGNSS